MRILVFSDSHGNRRAMERAVREQPTAEIILFLGDGAEEASEVQAALPKGKMMCMVRGNNDWCCSALDSDVLTVENKRIFFTHGHLLGVKYGLYQAVCAARSKEADILLFGHTHQSRMDYDDGLYIMNPGALSHSWNGAPSYGTIDLTPAGILMNIVELQ